MAYGVAWVTLILQSLDVLLFGNKRDWWERPLWPLYEKTLWRVIAIQSSWASCLRNERRQYKWVVFCRAVLLNYCFESALRVFESRDRRVSWKLQHSKTNCEITFIPRGWIGFSILVQRRMLASTLHYQLCSVKWFGSISESMNFWPSSKLPVSKLLLNMSALLTHMVSMLTNHSPNKFRL